MPRSLRRILRDSRGVTVLEFALVSPLLVTTLLVLFDLGYRAYATSVLEGALHRAARFATIGNMTPAQIDDYVEGQIALFSPTATPEIVKKSYSEFSGVNKPEKYRELSTPVNAVYNRGVDCYFDDNRNNIRDLAAGSGSANSLGGSDSIIFYSASMTFDRLFPLGVFMGWSNRQTVTVDTVLRNQPYGTRSFPECKYES